MQAIPETKIGCLAIAKPTTHPQITQFIPQPFFFLMQIKKHFFSRIRNQTSLKSATNQKADICEITETNVKQQSNISKFSYAMPLT